MNYINTIVNAIAENMGYAEAALYIILGAAVAYYKCNVKLQKYVAYVISEAEKTYSGAKVGGAKLAWVVGKLYDMVPLPLKAIITRQMIETIVQGTFNSMATYAKTQLDKLVDTAIPDTTSTEE